MRTLLIENQPFADLIKKTYPAELEIIDVSQFQTAEVIAEEIKIRYSGWTDMYMINVNLKIGTHQLSENIGIMIMKLLRLNYIDNHVILYSWLSREMLMGNLRNTIIFSKGLSFFRLPDLMSAFPNINNEKLPLEKANESELLQLFRAEYNPDDRHFNANIFGVWQLIKIQDAYDRLFGGGIKYGSDDESRKKINHYLDSYNGKLLQFIRGKEVDYLAERLGEEINLRDERVRREMLQYAVDSIQSIDKEVEKIEVQITTIHKLIAPNSNQNKENDSVSVISEVLRWLERRANERAEKKLFSRVMDETREYVDRKEELKKERQRCLEIKHWAETPSNNPLSDFDISGFNDGTIKGIRARLWTGQPKIVYVDDMANEGWADVLKRIIYRYPACYKRFKTIVPQYIDNDKEFVDSVVDAICKIENPDLIILDLRLKDERGYYAPAELSGFKVMQELDRKNISCGVLVFTASNKVWSLKEAFKDNVVSYWTKGELDRSDGKDDSVNNYLDLLSQIDFLTNYKWLFELLAKITATMMKIDNTNEPYWWEDKRLCYINSDNKFHKKKTDKRQIINILNRAKQAVQSNMRQMFFFENNDQAKNSMINTLVMNITDVLEEIHYYGGDGVDYIRLIDRMNAVGKQNVVKHMKIRNQSAHNGYLSHRQEDVVEYVEYVLDYLITEPDEIVNYPNLFELSETKDEFSSDRNNTQTSSFELTPVDKRKAMLLGGKVITVMIDSVKEGEKNGNKGYFYNYSIDSKSDKEEGVFVSGDIPCYQEGDIIKVRYSSLTPSLFAFVSGCSER